VVSGRAVKRHTQSLIQISRDKTLTDSPKAFSIASDHGKSLIDFGESNAGMKADAPV
jgi:thiamine pyrophosphokinase